MYGSLDLSQLSSAISRVLGKVITINSARTIGGGSISNTYKLIANTQTFFLKENKGITAKAMFAAEIKGLKLLKEKSRFSVPEVIDLVEIEDKALLLLQFIEPASQSNTYWQDLAINLAELHQNTSAYYGLDYHNFIGSLSQPNKLETDWSSFFINQRIIPMVQLAFDRAYLGKNEVTEIEFLLKKITDLMPKERPALLHGDLWSGNLLVDSLGNPCLIDPAVYYGHREMDIAFSHLFGGFSKEFYEVYQEATPMEPGFDQRINLYNIYPLLVHLNLFGRSYYADIKSTISRFT